MDMWCMSLADDCMQHMQHNHSQQSPHCMHVGQGLNIRVTPMPPLIANILKAAKQQPSELECYSCLATVELGSGESLESRMMGFQKEGVKFALRRGGRVLIGDEMGLGKTVQACALLKCYEDDWPALIVAPSSLRWVGWVCFTAKQLDPSYCAVPV